MIIFIALELIKLELKNILLTSTPDTHLYLNLMSVIYYDINKLKVRRLHVDFTKTLF